MTGFRIGIDLGGSKIEGAAIDTQGEPRVRRRVSTPAGDYHGTIAAIVRTVGSIEREIGGPATVGVGMPGAISPARGLVKNANSTCLNGRPFHRDLEVALARPVRVANDANCFALSEATDGAAAECRTVFGVILGTGVGGGIVIDGQILVGANAIGGEWGHNPLPWPTGDERPGPDCYCGRSGCIETFLSGPAMAADHRHHFGEGLNPAEIVGAADRGDERCRATVARYVDRLARGLAMVINLIDPDAIVLGGGLSKIGLLYREVPRLWGRYVFSGRVDTRLLAPAYGDFERGARGGMAMAPGRSALTTLCRRLLRHRQKARPAETCRPFRLIGIGADMLVEESEADLPTLFERELGRRRRLERAIDNIRDKLGPDGLRRGRARCGRQTARGQHLTRRAAQPRVVATTR